MTFLFDAVMDDYALTTPFSSSQFHFFSLFVLTQKGRKKSRLY